LPPESKAEQRQLRAFGEVICSDKDSLKHLIGACEIARKHRDVARRKAREAKYEHLGAIYKLLCAAFANPEIMDGMRKEAARMNIPTAATTSTALLFVKTLSHKSLEPATASQQAMALRGAVLKGIAPEEFALRVPKLGGITKLAEHFKAHHRSSAQTAQKLARQLPLKPQLIWPPNAIARWERLSTKGTPVYLTVQKTSQSGWKVLSVSRRRIEKEVRHER